MLKAVTRLKKYRALSFPARGICVRSPIQFIQLHNQVFVRLHHLYTVPFYDDRLWVRSGSSEVQHDLPEVLNQFPLLFLLSTSDATHSGRVIRKLLL